MAEFKKLSAVEAVASVSDTASILIEENGVIKRAPKSEISGDIKDKVVSWNDLTDKPQLPILIKVYEEESIDTGIKCRCDLTEWEVEQLMAQGAFLYAALYYNSENNWIMSKDAGFLYCNRYSYPDDDIVIFTSPDGKRNITFSSTGTVTYTWN